MLHRLRQWIAKDDGGAGLVAAIVVPALLLLGAVLVDSRGEIRAWQRADNIASEAARTAGQQIDVSLAMSGGTKQLDPQRAYEAGMRYLQAAGAEGDVIPGADGLTVRVTVKLRYSPVLLGFIGRGPVEVSGESTAQLITG